MDPGHATHSLRDRRLLARQGLGLLLVVKLSEAFPANDWVIYCRLFNRLSVVEGEIAFWRPIRPHEGGVGAWTRDIACIISLVSGDNRALEAGLTRGGW